jgi:uncharacterized membrane protein YqjE
MTGLQLAALIGVVVFVLSLAAPAFYRLLNPIQATTAILLVMGIIATIVLSQRAKATKVTAGDHELEELNSRTEMLSVVAAKLKIHSAFGNARISVETSGSGASHSTTPFFF